jgi:hypothetical protein
MKTLRERLEYCDWQIAQAIEESHRPHTEAEHLGILLWEMDWRAEREHVLAELAAQTEAALKCCHDDSALASQASTIHH